MTKETNQIRVLLNRPGHVVSPLVYGQFMEHLGGCIYDGIWVGPDSKVPNDDGLRLDTVEALKKLELPVVRWPGGLFSDNYHWRDGIGPRERRPVRHNIGWNQLESNQFGTHEFMRFCRLIGTEPFISVNMGSGTVAEARDWAEYCNCELDTTLTRERAANGSPEPFRVKFWGLGNEPAYDMDGLMLPEHYIHLARQYAGYLKHFASQAQLPWDANIQDAKLIWAVWSHHELLKEMMGRGGGKEYVDFLFIHFYHNGGIGAKPADMPEGEYFERVYLGLIAAVGGLRDRINQVGQFARDLSTEKHACRISVDEWGTWYPEADFKRGLVQRAPLTDALFAAAVFHLFHANEVVGMANMAQTMNVLQPLIKTDGAKFCVTPTYHVWEMFRPHKGGTFLPVELERAETITLPGKGDRDALSVSATKSPNGDELFVSVLNFDLTKDITADLAVAGGETWAIKEARVLTADGLNAQNTFDAPERVKPVRAKVKRTSRTLTFKPKSVTTVALRKK